MIKLFKKILCLPAALIAAALLFIVNISLYLFSTERFKAFLKHNEMVFKILDGDVLACYVDISQLSEKEVEDLVSYLGKGQEESDKDLLDGEKQ